MYTVPIKLSGLFWNVMKVREKNVMKKTFSEQSEKGTREGNLKKTCLNYMICMYESGHNFNELLQIRPDACHLAKTETEVCLPLNF